MDAAVKATFGADTSDLRKGGEESEGIIKSFSDRATAALGEVGASFLKAFAVEGIVEKLTEMGKQVFENAERIQNLSRELNVGTTALQSFGFIVRETGGTMDAAQKGFEHTRLSLDQLNEGSKTAVEAFEKLGLTAADLVGLSLDQSLEKIARAYEENSTKAGAYDAIATILGKRTAPQLMNAMQELAEVGFAGVNAQAEKFGQVVSPDSINLLSTTVKGLSAAWNFVKTGVSELLADIVRLGESIDALATGNITALKQIWADRNKEIAETEKQIGAAAAATNTEFDGTTEHLKKHKVALDDLLGMYGEINRDVAATAKGHEKLVALGNEYVTLMLAASSNLRTQEERTAALAEAAKVKSEYDKYSAEYAAQSLAAYDRSVEAYDKLKQKVQESADKLKLESLPATERILFLEQERDKVLQDQSTWGETANAYLQDQVKINELDLQIEKDKLDVLKEQAKEKKAAAAAAANFGKNGEMFIGGGLIHYDNPAQQAEYEKRATDSYAKQLQQELAQRQSDLAIDKSQSGPYAAYLAANEASAIAALQYRIAHAYSAIFDPKYSDALGGSVLAQQIAQANGANTPQAAQTLTDIHTILKNTIGSG